MDAIRMCALGKTACVFEISFLIEGILEAVGFWSLLLMPMEKRMFVGWYCVCEYFEMSA